MCIRRDDKSDIGLAEFGRRPTRPYRVSAQDASTRFISFRESSLGDAQKLMTRLGEGHGLRLFPFPRAFPVIASVATTEPEAGYDPKRTTAIPNRCQLEPIASSLSF